MCPASVSAETNRKVFIIANSDEGPYQQTLKSFKDQLSLGLKVVVSELFLGRIDNKPATVSAAIREHEPDVIYALGEAATELAMQSTSSIPIVSTLVLNNNLFKQAGNVTGVSLSYTLATQFAWLKKIFPEKTKVAILYNPAENDQTIASARKLAQQAGLELFAIPVETPRQLPYALEQLAKNIEVLLAIPDDVAMSSKTAKAVLLASFRNKVPLIGLSDNWVKSGALYALTWDYDDLGRECADQTGKLLNKTPLQEIALEYPRKVVYSYNEKIAAHMNLEISDTLSKHAKMTFK